MISSSFAQAAGISDGGHVVGISFDGGIDDHYTGKLTN
jgi:hypothetical protein